MDKKLSLASDHAGYDLKEYIKKVFTEKGYELKDYGAFSNESVDYPDYAHPAARAVNDGEFNRGIVICGSGEGVSIVANKYPNVRCGLAYNIEIASLIRKHNDANMIALPARFVSFEDAKQMVEIFLNTEFERGRHSNRVEKIKIKDSNCF